LSLSKVVAILVEACIAGNAKKLLNWSSLPRNFSATARTKNSRLVPKLVLRHVLSGNIQLVAFWGVTTNHRPKLFDLSHLHFLVEFQSSRVGTIEKNYILEHLLGQNDHGTGH
jgi:hypothetical protein